MLNISKIQNVNLNNTNYTNKSSVNKQTADFSMSKKLKMPTSEQIKAYHPSFSKANDNNTKLKKINTYLDKESKIALERLKKNGILFDNKSDDGSTVLDNLYKIATEPRIKGLNSSSILKEVIKAIDKPSSITQKFGDIPDNIAQEIQNETGEEVNEKAKHVISSSCVVASMEFNLASRNPAEFARFASGLSSENYSVEKNLKMSDFSDGTASGLWMLREFNTENKIGKNWEDVSINIKPDRNAIVRARVQTSYKDKDERSCVDVLIQSALLNLGSQNTYNSITDERTGKFNPDNAGLTDFEKNFVEQVIFEQPKISVVYQNLDENGYLVGYNCEPDETKQHILKSLNAGQNVIIGYTHLDSQNKVDGGHEITIIGYEQDKQGKGYFICNDTDDNIDEPIKMAEDELLPLIHHAGISKEALSDKDIIVEPWREIIEEFQKTIKSEN